MGILVVLIAYVFVGIILSIIGTSPDKIDCEERREVYVGTNGVHLDLIFPVESMDENLVEKFELPLHVKYVAFGWGDKGFYLETPTWDQLKFSVAMKATFLKSETAMHLTYLYKKQNSWGRMMICEEQYDKLIGYILNSFKKNEEGRIIEIKNSGYTYNDKFYEANGNYTFINTCNYWVNKGLKQSQIKTSIWSPFDYGVLYHVKRESSKDVKN